jgi:peptidoglycan/LPS O-acetylase OafA/YrhL
MSALAPAAVTPATSATSATPGPSLARFLELDLLDNRYPALHGLRVLGIVSVVQYHVTWILKGEKNIPFHPDWVAASLSIFFGMDLFFILSGFLIGSILLRSLEVEGSQQIRRFYVRRVFRTFPSYYVVLTFLVLVTPLTVIQRHNLVYEYSYLTNFVRRLGSDTLMFWGWSLALEEQFYLTVPLLFVALTHLRSDKARLALLVTLWAAALVVRLTLFLRHGSWTDLELYGALYFRSYTRFDTLVCGIILALIHRRWREPIGVWLKDPFHRALVALPSLACLWLLFKPDMFGMGRALQWVHVFAWGSLTSVMYLGFLLLLLHGHGWLHRALSLPQFRRIATLGYGVYLVHIPLLYAIIVPFARALDGWRVPHSLLWGLCLALLLALSLTLAYVMHVIIEKPSLRLREKLAA